MLCPIRQVAARLQKEVEDLVLEVFERLPQTVDGFRDGDVAGSGMEVSYCVHNDHVTRLLNPRPSHLVFAYSTAAEAPFQLKYY